MPTRMYPLAAILFLCTAAQAGTVLKTTNRDLAGTRPVTTTTVSAQDGKLRVESGDAQGNFAIFRDDALYAINPKDRTYTVMDRAAIKAMAEKISPALKQMQEQMAKMSPEQRAQMERMMGGKMPGMAGKAPVEEVRKTGKTGKVAGYDCTYAEVLEDGAVTHEVCVTPLSSIKGGKELYDASLKVSALMEDMIKSLDAPWLRQIANRQVENYAKLGGVPLISRMISNGKPVNESTLDSIAAAAMPGSVFEIPAGYTRKELMPQR